MQEAGEEREGSLMSGLEEKQTKILQKLMTELFVEVIYVLSTVVFKWISRSANQLQRKSNSHK